GGRRGDGANPVDCLEPGEKPSGKRGEVRILDERDLGRLVAHADPYRVLFAFLPYCGLRIGEALGLRWRDLNLDAGLLHVRQQLSRRRVPKQLKTPAAQREVVLAPALVTLLRERWLAAPHKAPGALVFCNALGRGLDYRDVGEGFRAAVKAAGLTGPGRLSLHSLRHTFASLLIAKGLDVVFVSRQLGHASPATRARRRRSGSTRTSLTRWSTRRRR